jgi:hypothetical protein
MRASLPHTLRERRRARADQHRRSGRAEPPAAPGAERVSDPAVARVRDAGGPIDKASYVCQCGFMFLAPVSTTVLCPHCRAPQAW